MIPLQLVRGDEWRLGPAVLKLDGRPVGTPSAYTITGVIAWPSGSLSLSPGNGRVVFDSVAGTWLFVVPGHENLVVPLGRVARLTAIMSELSIGTATSQSVTLEVKPS